MRLAGAIDLKAGYIPAIGGLLSFLVKHHLLPAADVDTSAEFAIQSLRLFEQGLQRMLIDRSTLLALNVFVDETPLVVTANRHKEGLSLFAVLHRCKSKPGAQLLRQWLSYPLSDADAICSRHDHVAFLCLPDHASFRDCLSSCLARVHNLPRLLSHFRAVRQKLADWLSLFSSIKALVDLHSLVSEIRRHSVVPRLFAEFNKAWDVRLPDVLHEVESLVDFGVSRESGVLRVRDGVWSELDQMRSHCASIGAFLIEVASADGFPIDEACYVYVPQLGYLLLVSNIDSNCNTNSIPDSLSSKTNTDDCIFQFRSDSNELYFKNARCQELDTTLGDVAGIVADMESSLVRELGTRLLEHSSALLTLAHLVAELDVYLALAVVAIDCNLVRPEIVCCRESDRPLEIIGGRHLLHEVSFDAFHDSRQFVANDTFMGVTQQAVMLLTGPNASGKSVYARQIALLVLMAQCGSFVPAQSARIAPCDALLARLDWSSLSNVLSSFQFDMAAIGFLLRHVTESSLVIIDEFGKGTRKQDGIALIAALIKHLVAVGGPKAIIITHFHELWSHPILLPPPSCPRFFCCHMRFLVHDDTQLNDEQRVVFLFQIAPGVCLESLGAHCAALAGVPPGMSCLISPVFFLINLSSILTFAEVCSRANVIKEAIVYDSRIQALPMKTRFQRCKVLELENIWQAFLRIDPLKPATAGQLLDFIQSSSLD
jgi:DNA mismatch repair protein MSH5